MTIRDLRAFLSNIQDDLPIYIIREGVFTILEEDDLDIITFGAGDYIGPTALTINNNTKTDDD